MTTESYHHAAMDYTMRHLDTQFDRKVTIEKRVQAR